MRASYLQIVVCALLCGCFGEDALSYRGTALRAPDAQPGGHDFDAEPNPDGLPPIVGATVSLSVGSRRTEMVVTDVDGAWGPLDSGVFGLGFDDGPRIRIRVEAPGFTAFAWVKDYFDTSEDETSSTLFMNIRMVDELPDADTSCEELSTCDCVAADTCELLWDLTGGAACTGEHCPGEPACVAGGGTPLGCSARGRCTPELVDCDEGCEAALGADGCPTCSCR